MATRYIRYPTITASGGGGSEQALSPDGGPLPSEIKVVGGYDGSAVQVLSTDNTGKLNVNASISFPSSIVVTQPTAANLNVTAYQGGTWSIAGAGGGSIATDIFGTAVTATRYNQLEVNFETSPSSSLITNTTANGGSVTSTNGHQLYSTGANVNGSSKGVSTQSVTYRPGSEIYSYFTAAFTTPTSVNSYQRIGIYDTNNGFFIGYNGTTFGVTLRTGGADTFTARASWNGDPLDGSSGSQFTRGGVPEAINFTYTNVWRIRFGWLGSASIVFEVLSPDEQWIVFNTIRIPNSQLNPSIQNPDLPMTIDVKKTAADATSLTMATGCWAAGASTNTQPITTTLTDNSLAFLTRAVITGYSSAGGGSYNNVKVTPSGSLTVAIGDITGIVGQNTMANSIPVVIASNQSAVPVSGSVTVSGTVAATQSGTWNLNNITGTVSLPTGAATESTLSTLNNKIPSNLTVTATRLLVDGSGVTQPVSGSVSVSNFPATQPVSGTVTANQGGSWTVAATQSGTWNINNVSGTVSLPTGAATSAKQPALGVAGTASSDVITVQGITGMTALKVDGSGSTQPISGTVTANQGGTWNINNISGTVSLPTGAATESTLSTLNGKVPSGLTVTSTRLLVDGSGVTQPISGSVSVSNFPATQPISGSVSVSNFPATQPVSGTVTANAGTGNFTVVQSTAANLNATVTGTVAATQSGTWSTRLQDGSGNVINSTSNALNVNVQNSSLTVAQATAANLNATVVGTGTFAVQAAQSGNWNSRTQDGSGNSITSTTNALDVNVKSSNISFNGPGGRTSFLLYRNVYSTTSVTTAAYTQVVASLASNVNIIDIFDSSGQTMVIATGAAGAEVNKAYIYPGGNGQIPLAITAGTRVAIKAISANAVSGEINMTFYT